MSIISSLRMMGGRLGLQISKHSPEILMVTGILGMVTAAVLASKATLSLHEVVDETQETIDNIEAAKDEYPEPKQYREELVIAKTIKVASIVKLYAPAIVLGGVSIACIVGSNRIISRRNLALMAAYKLIDEKFKDYRDNVIEELGPEKDKEFIRKTPQKKTLVKVGDTNKGTLTNRKFGYSIYAREFNETNPNWARTRDYNMLFLTSVQNWCNDILRGRGHIFLNEVYDHLGLPRSTEGQAVGWVYDKVREIGDNYVDFGLLDPSNQLDLTLVEEEVNHNPPIKLDFNVDGIIWDLI